MSVFDGALFQVGLNGHQENTTPFDKTPIPKLKTKCCLALGSKGRSSQILLLAIAKAAKIGKGRKRI